MKELDLDKPADARKFLRGVRIQGRSINQVHLENGRILEVEAMSDSEAIRYAKDIYLDYCGGIEGRSGQVDLEGVDQ